MAKRKNKGLFDEIASTPWWFGVIFAFAVFLVFKSIPVFSGIAEIFAVIFLIPAFISFIKELQRNKLIENTNSLESIRQIGWKEFEMLVGEYFRRNGYFVQENGGGGADGGIDLVLTKANQKTIVQCKRWKNVQVGVSPIRELYGVMVAENASACIFVSSGRYTQEAESFASNKPIELINGDALYKLISEVRSTKNSINVPDNLEKTTNQTSIVCPKCGSGMVERIAKRGQNIGKKFYGCSNYPSCNGTIS